MNRMPCPPRFANPTDKTALSKQEFFKTYWNEGTCYSLTAEQIERDIYPAAREASRMHMEILPDLLQDDSFMNALLIPEHLRDYVRRSKEMDNTAILGRMDFAYDGKTPPRLLEYNADTPAILYETGFYQGKWLDDMIAMGWAHPDSGQFNTLQDDLMAALQSRKDILQDLHIACLKNAEEDRMTVGYVENCAKHVGLNTHFMHYEDIIAGEDGSLRDQEGRDIKAMYKFYPWEWIFNDEKYSRMLAKNNTLFMEPAWKFLFSNKLILAKLWEKFPGHDNLLPAFAESNPRMKSIWHDCVRKPVLSREGGNIEIISNGMLVAGTHGPYDYSGYVLQKRYHMQSQDNHFPIVTVWIVDGKPSALGMREQKGSPIVDTSGLFVPHLVIA